MLLLLLHWVQFSDSVQFHFGGNILLLWPKSMNHLSGLGWGTSCNDFVRQMPGRLLIKKRRSLIWSPTFLMFTPQNSSKDQSKMLFSACFNTVRRGFILQREACDVHTQCLLYWADTCSSNTITLWMSIIFLVPSVVWTRTKKPSPCHWGLNRRQASEPWLVSAYTSGHFIVSNLPELQVCGMQEGSGAAGGNWCGHSRTYSFLYKDARRLCCERWTRDMNMAV